ncbi:MAG: beta-lactamase protein [Prosthecobacter sp.]|nr:beta-lactamase protein [Prosthecobacter sp.]
MSHPQVALTNEAIAELDHPEDGTHEIAADLAYRRLAMVNVVFFGTPHCEDRGWVLIDTGVSGLGKLIENAAAERFGKNNRPAAIILTHGHFDHVGNLKALAEAWDAPIYAHPLEYPYLTGKAAYPPPDTSVGGGIMPTFAPLFPAGPIDVSNWLNLLPENGEVPFMPGWRWIHTPGHSPGHVSLWRESDRALIAGDAFITTHQESAYSVITQKPEMHGPPTYFTIDWEASRKSVVMLAELEPDLAVTGHGRAMQGPQMLAALQVLAWDFQKVAGPPQGRYVLHPARAEDGSAYREP